MTGSTHGRGLRRDWSGHAFLWTLVFLCGLPSFPSAMAADPAPAIGLMAIANPATVLPGGFGTLGLSLKNAGTVLAYQLAVTLRSADPALGLTDATRIPLGALGPGDATTIAPYTFQVASDAAPGIYRATFQFDYAYTLVSTGDPQWGGQAFSVAVTVRSAQVVSLVAVTPSELSPGHATELGFTIRNAGPGAVDNVQFTWQTPANTILPVGSGNTMRIPRIEANAQETVRAFVITGESLPPGLYALTGSIRYTDAGGVPQNTTTTAGLVVSRTTAVEVNLQEWTSNGLVLAVSNVGTARVGAVELRLRGASTEAPHVVLLGNLDPGDFTTATFPADAIPDATGRLMAQLAYTDAAGRRQAQPYAVPVGEPPGPAAINPPPFGARHPWLVAGGAALVAVAGTLGWLRMRKRRHRAKE